MLRKQSQAWHSTAHAHPALRRALLQELALGQSQPKPSHAQQNNQPCPGAPDCRQAAAPTTQSADVRQYLRSSDTWATGDAQSRVVRATPTSGSNLLMRLTMPGKHSFASTPTTVGTSTTWNVEIARPCSKRRPIACWFRAAQAVPVMSDTQPGDLDRRMLSAATQSVFSLPVRFTDSFIVASIPEHG